VAVEPEHDREATCGRTVDRRRELAELAKTFSITPATVDEPFELPQGHVTDEISSALRDEERW
jgi:hypothetical protein